MTDVPELPEYIEELSSEQREKLLEFIEQFDQCYNDGSFDKGAQWNDAELLALGLRVAEILGFEGESLERLFYDEFGVSGMGDEGAIGDMLAIAMRVDVENRIRCAGGGRN
jgi:hypothetical protein